MADELKTIPIKAPRLNQPGYGSNIEKVFENIDTNFRIVGNHDFVKGNTGNCVGSKPIRILNGDRFTQEGMSILNAIIQQIDSTIELDPKKNTKSDVKEKLNEYLPLKSVRVGDKEISLIDGFTDTDIINLITLYDPMYKEDTEKPIGATNDYLFRDPRFVYLVDDAQGQYSSLYDCSCTVHMQLQDGSEDFVCRVIQNAPTLYYDSTQQTFCWRIGGRETGIIAQGPSGKSGVSAFTYIVRVEPTGNSYGVSGSGNLRKIDGYGVVGYIDPKIASWKWIDDPKEFPSDWTGSTCLALCYSTESKKLQGVYVSIISENNTVFCNDTNNLPTEFDVNHFMSAMAQINVAGGGENCGLFIPMGTPPIDEDGKMNGSLHAIWSALNLNDEDKTKASELHISPLTSGMAGVRAAYGALSGSSISGSTGIPYVQKMSKHVDGDARLFADYNTVVLDGPADEGRARLGIGTDDFNGLDCGILMKKNSEIRMPEGTITAAGGLTIDGDATITGDATIAGKVSCGELSSDGSTLLNGSVTITEDTTINSDASIKGELSVTGIIAAKVNDVPSVYLGCPIGTIVMWAGEKAPEGWRLCNGDSISVTNANTSDYDYSYEYNTQTVYKKAADPEYRNLVKVIARNYGSEGTPPRENNVLLPDLRQKFPLGAKDDDSWSCGGEKYDTNLGETGGESGHTLTADESGLPAHTHKLNYDVGPNAVNQGGRPYSINSADGAEQQSALSASSDAAQDASSAHNNIPPFIAINFIIKYK